MDELSRMREQLAKLHKSATAKVSRLKRTKNADIAGTRFDPRKDAKRQQRLTKAQTAAQIERLSAFVDRKTQFVGLGDQATQRNDPKNRIVTAKRWQTFKLGEGGVNNIVQNDLAALSKTKIPFTGRTIPELEAERPRVRAAGDRVNRIYETFNTTPRMVPDVEALDTWTEKRMRQLQPEYKTDKIRNQRAAHDKMLDAIGADKLREQANAWTDDQFYVYWNYGNNAANVGHWYAIATETYGTQKDEARSNQATVIKEELGVVFDWTSNLPTELSASEKRTRTTRKRR